jgi:hypothetical protein
LPHDPDRSPARVLTFASVAADLPVEPDPDLPKPKPMPNPIAKATPDINTFIFMFIIL